MKIYRVGILGFGMIGKVHAYGYLNLPLFYDPVPLEARITHVVTSRAETAEKARQTLGADVAATDYRSHGKPRYRHRSHLHAQPPPQGRPVVGHARSRSTSIATSRWWRPCRGGGGPRGHAPITAASPR